jgi:hypothetical protein
MVIARYFFNGSQARRRFSMEIVARPFSLGKIMAFPEQWHANCKPVEFKRV